MAFAVWVASVLLILLAPVAVVIPYLMATHPDMLQSPELPDFLKNDPSSILLQVLSVIPAHVFTLLIAYLVVTLVRPV